MKDVLAVSSSADGDEPSLANIEKAFEANNAERKKSLTASEEKLEDAERLSQDLEH